MNRPNKSSMHSGGHGNRARRAMARRGRAANGLLILFGALGLFIFWVEVPGAAEPSMHLIVYALAAFVLYLILWFLFHPTQLSRRAWNPYSAVLLGIAVPVVIAMQVYWISKHGATADRIVALVLYVEVQILGAVIHGVVPSSMRGRRKR